MLSRNSWWSYSHPKAELSLEIDRSFSTVQETADGSAVSPTTWLLPASLLTGSSWQTGLIRAIVLRERGFSHYRSGPLTIVFTKIGNLLIHRLHGVLHILHRMRLFISPLLTNSFAWRGPPSSKSIWLCYRSREECTYCNASTSSPTYCHCLIIKVDVVKQQ